MNREEAKEYAFKLEERLYPFDKKSLAMIIDKIYDDFESRTCENCEYYIHTLEDWSCSNVKSILYTYEYALERDETCTKFERKATK